MNTVSLQSIKFRIFSKFLMFFDIKEWWKITNIALLQYIFFLWLMRSFESIRDYWDAGQIHEPSKFRKFHKFTTFEKKVK